MAADVHDGLGNYRVITNFRSRRMKLKDVLAAMDSLATEAASLL